MIDMQVSYRMKGLGEAMEWLRRIFRADGIRAQKRAGRRNGKRGMRPAEGPEARIPYDYSGMRWRGGPQ